MHKAEGELERASVNLSNLATYIDDTIAFACNLSSYWQKMDFEMCQGIQKLVFPEGVKWDKESRSYRTTNYNSFFLKHYTVYQIVTRVGKKKEEDTASKFRTHLLRITSV